MVGKTANRYRIVGTVLLAAGAFILLFSFIGLVAQIELYQYLSTSSPSFVAVLEPIMGRIAPIIQQLLGLLFAVFCLMMGYGLLTMKSWARSIGVAFFCCLAIAGFALTLMLFLQLVAVQSSITARIVVLMLGLALSVGMGVFGMHLNSLRAVDAFSSSVTVPGKASLKQELCPTCGGKLDMNKAQCPKCDAPDGGLPPRRGRLIDEETGREYIVGVRQPTYIGREGIWPKDAPVINLNDPEVHSTVSGRHAYIEYFKGFHLHAEDDSLGTYVNDERVRDAEIKDDDTLTFGNASLTFKVDTD
jgi:hypothetical protein